MENSEKLKKKNKFGQYFIQEEMADFMLNLADININSKILDPCSGEGVFIDLFFQKGYKNITAYEIDKELAKSFEELRNKAHSEIKASISALVEGKKLVILNEQCYID